MYISDSTNHLDDPVELSAADDWGSAAVDDWGTEVEVEEWREDHEQQKVNKPQQQQRAGKVQHGDVIVASCSDDGTVNVWRPLRVCLK